MSSNCLTLPTLKSEEMSQIDIKNENEDSPPSIRSLKNQSARTEQDQLSQSQCPPLTKDTLNLPSVKTKYSDRFECKDCHKHFISSAALYIHKKFRCSPEKQLHPPVGPPHRSTERKNPNMSFADTNFPKFFRNEKSLDANNLDCSRDKASSPYTGSTAVCPRCGKSFLHLDRHLARSRCSLVVFMCYHCALKYKTKNRLLHHILSKHLKMTGNFKCSHCLREYQFKGGLQRHLKVECEKKVCFPCVHCRRNCQSERNLLAHLLTRHKGIVANDLSPHTPIWRLECNDCSELFENESDFYNHVKYDCQRDPLSPTTPL